LSDAKEPSGILRRIKYAWNSGLFKSILMLGVLILGMLTLHKALTLILRTEYPLTTPISNSMYPKIKVGDLLIVQGGLKGEDIHADPVDGDIIVFKDPRGGSTPIVHRAIYRGYDEARKEYFFRTKGDNNRWEDPWVVWESTIYGKVIFVIPYLGYIKIYLGNELGIALTIILLVTLLLLENLDLLKKRKKESVGEKE